MNDLVYLGGGITGLSYEEATEWRRVATTQLLPLRALSPLRAKIYLAGESVIYDTYPDYPLSTARGIVCRDRFDCQRSGVVIFNLLGANRVSIGSVIEIAWADAAGVPVICIMEPEGNPHEHAMVRELTDFRVTTLDEAVHIARCLLLPDPYPEPIQDTLPHDADVVFHAGVPYGLQARR